MLMKWKHGLPALFSDSLCNFTVCPFSTRMSLLRWISSIWCSESDLKPTKFWVTRPTIVGAASCKKLPEEGVLIF